MLVTSCQALFQGLGKQQQAILYRPQCPWSSYSTVFTSQWDCGVSRIRYAFISLLCLSAAGDGNRVFDRLGLSVLTCNMDIIIPSYSSYSPVIRRIKLPSSSHPLPRQNLELSYKEGRRKGDKTQSEPTNKSLIKSSPHLDLYNPAGHRPPLPVLLFTVYKALRCTSLFIKPVHNQPPCKPITPTLCYLRGAGRNGSERGSAPGSCR